MIVVRILYMSSFEKQFKQLPKKIQLLAISKEDIFRANPLHPSLRLHKLKSFDDGVWSISLNMKYRIIFKIQTNGDILFVSIGTHAIYEV